MIKKRGVGLTTDQFIIDTFREYCGVKLHFNNKNYLYNGVNNFKNFKPETLLKRNDWKLFKRVAEKFWFNESCREDYFITQFLKNKNTYITDMLKESSDIDYMNRKKTLDSLDFYVNKDIESICIYYNNKGYTNLSDIVSTNGDRPLIYKDFYANRLNITFETLSLIHNVVKFDKESLIPSWEDRVLLFDKYNHFIYNDAIIKNIEKILKNNFNFDIGIDKDKNCGTIQDNLNGNIDIQKSKNRDLLSMEYLFN